MRKFVTAVFAISTLAAAGDTIVVKLRSRVESPGASVGWREVAREEKLAPRQTALIICDMWDKHWCRGATERVNVLARKAAPFIGALRRGGVLIIHAPSDTMEHYKDAPQRQGILRLARVEPPAPREIKDPPLPIDDSDGGCDTTDNAGPVNFRAWTREHPSIPLAEADLISDNGREVYSALKERGVGTLLIMGVHTNMCVLNRTFAIKQMTRWGIRCILVRDLTDAMYNPKARPYVSHDRGTQLVIEHIEKYWCPTVTSDQLLAALRP